jgi:tripartite-type tricarboxylate transporter receptor subunit TctC
VESARTWARYRPRSILVYVRFATNSPTVEVNAALVDPTFKARVTDLGAEPFASSPAEFGKFITDEIDKWAKVIKFAGIKAE